MWGKFQNIGFGNNFLDVIATMAKIDKWDYIKLKKTSAKHTSQEVEVT